MSNTITRFLATAVVAAAAIIGGAGIAAADSPDTPTTTTASNDHPHNDDGGTVDGTDAGQGGSTSETAETRLPECPIYNPWQSGCE